MKEAKTPVLAPDAQARLAAVEPVLAKPARTRTPSAGADVPFWKRKTLDKMTKAEWESLCDGCGRCCLIKLEDEDTSRIYFTNVACQLLDGASCQCRNYPDRKSIVPDCVKLTTKKLAEITWLPPSCAYRLVEEGKDLLWWHPLVSGSTETVHQSGASVRNKVSASELDVPVDDLPDYIVQWPGRMPRKAKPGV